MHRSSKWVLNEVPELHIKLSYEAQFSTTLKVKKYFAENMWKSLHVNAIKAHSPDLIIRTFFNKLSQCLFLDMFKEYWQVYYAVLISMQMYPFMITFFSLYLISLFIW